jgi:hypothetical protein
LLDVAAKASVKKSRVVSTANLMSKVRSKANVTDSQTFEEGNKQTNNKISAEKLELNRTLQSQEFKNIESSENKELSKTEKVKKKAENTRYKMMKDMIQKEINDPNINKLRDFQIKKQIEKQAAKHNKR